MSLYEPFARFYDSDHDSYQDDLLLYQELARRTGGPILEVMCGTGRLAVPLADSGYRVVGLDNAPEMLTVARRKLAAAGLGRRVKLVEGDVRDFTLNARFRLAVVGVNSFLHLESGEQQLRALRSIARHLERDGLLVLDLLNPLAEDLSTLTGEVVLERSFTLPESGRRVQKFVSRRADVATQTIEVAFFYDELDEEGRLFRHAPPPFLLHWLYRFEAEHLLARAGLEIEGVFGSYDLGDYEAGSERLIILAHTEE